MEPLLILPLLVSFLVTLFTLPWWIAKTKKIGLSWEDMNKYKSEKVAGSGGLIVTLGFILGVLFYVFLKTFYFKIDLNIIEILAMVASTLLLSGIGLVDDLLGWWHGGLSRTSRIIMCIFAAIPLIVINAGDSSTLIPFLNIQLGLIYPIFFIPLGIVGASTTFNFLAGYNGLEAGQGAIILSGLSFVAYFMGNRWVSVIGMCMVLALLAFLIYNKYPAKVFPGDVLTYPVGGLIAIVAILGNMEKVAVFFFIPYIFEVILKSRGKLIKHSFGKPNRDGSLEMPYEKFYGLEHVAIYILKKIRGKAREREVVILIWIFQAALVLLGILIFKNNIF
jgi:UDP-N-acetylglucosamine--dolichyl-phosphate N-acetylglucosaminephosphotransferase